MVSARSDSAFGRIKRKLDTIQQSLNNTAQLCAFAQDGQLSEESYTALWQSPALRPAGNEDAIHITDTTGFFSGQLGVRPAQSILE